MADYGVDVGQRCSPPYPKGLGLLSYGRGMRFWGINHGNFYNKLFKNRGLSYFLARTDSAVAWVQFMGVCQARL